VKINIKSFALASLAIAAGLVVLLGYFIELPLLISARAVLLQWAVILTGIALLVGIVNLGRVHWHKVRSAQAGSVYSVILLVALILTLLLAGYSGPTAGMSLWIFKYIQLPIETSLMALLAIILAYAAARLFYRRLNIFTLIFVVTALLVILGSISFPLIDFAFLRYLRVWISQVLATAGARGILLGIGLGIVATGLRILMGADRPYGG
jgi:hypothetical protein